MCSFWNIFAMADPGPPSMCTTLSVASPDKAAQIRSAVTGALKKDSSGMLCFETTVETTFVLPWDLNPMVEPEKLSVSVRDQIRTDLLDQEMLSHLEGCGSINWNTTVTWQCRAITKEGVAIEGKDDWENANQLSELLEAGYHSTNHHSTFVLDLASYEVDYIQHRLFNIFKGLFEIRRLAFCPLMPMKTEAGPSSLFHACSLAFWGIHDRTSLLKEAVDYCLGDPKAQFLLYDRWSQQLDAESPATKKEFPQWEAAKKDFCKCPRLHIFALANIVQRPIIIYAHPNSNVRGVYLPLLWKNSHGQFTCHTHTHLRNPIALGYNVGNNHFSPLITFKGPKGPHPLLLPLASSSEDLLPIHFLLPAERSGDPLSILSELMYVDLIPPLITPHNTFPPQTQTQTLAAVSNASELPEVMDTLVKRYQSLFL